MSYILDALKKSEQERGHGNVPDVQTVHSSSLHYRSEKKAYWPYILIVAVLLNLAAIAYFIFDKNTPADISHNTMEDTSRIQTTADDNTDSVTQGQPATPAPLVSENMIQGPDSPTAIGPDATAGQNPQEAALEKTLKPAATTKKTPAPSQTVMSTPEPQAASADSNDEIIDFHELPESFKQQLPTITISAHVYSSNPLQRSIVINNNFMEEGEYILDDLILYEITKNGAIFNYRGTLFNYGVVSGWQ